MDEPEPDVEYPTPKDTIPFDTLLKRYLKYFTIQEQ